MASVSIDISAIFKKASFTEDDYARIKDVFAAMAKKPRSLRQRYDTYLHDEYIAHLEEMPKMTTRSPFKKGRVDPSALSSGSRFLSIKDGEAVTFAPLLGLDGMIRANMHEYWDIRPAVFHPCIGAGCPGCATGNEARFKGYLPVYTKEGETLIYAFTISVYRQLADLEDEIEGKSLKGYVVKIKRNGTSFSTKYTVVGTGKRLDVSEVELPDFVDSLGPTTEETIVELLQDNGLIVPGVEGDGFATASASGEPDGPMDDDEDDEDDIWGDL